MLIFKNRNKYKKDHTIFVVGMALVHACKCYTERNKIKREVREVAIIAVLADGGMAIEPFPTTTKGLVFYNLFHVIILEAFSRKQYASSIFEKYLFNFSNNLVIKFANF
jgi:hypothetical protein